MEEVFIQTLSTPSVGLTHIQMIKEIDCDDKLSIFLTQLTSSNSTIRIKIHLSDANDILDALGRVQQVINKAIKLGQIV